MSLLDRIRPGVGAANERAKIILAAAEAGMGDNAARQFADSFRSFDEACAELERRKAAEAAKAAPAKPSEVIAMCSRLKLPAAEAEAILAEGLTMEAAQARLADAWAAKGDRHEYAPRAEARVGQSWGHGEGFRARAADALTAMLDPRHEPTKGRGLASSLSDLAMCVARAEGHKPFSRGEAVNVVMAAHSGSDFPLIVADAMSNTVARGLAQQQPAIMRATHEIQRDTYHEGRSITLSASAMPEEVAEGGEVKHTTMSERGELLPTPRDFAAIFSMTNKLVQNDRLDLMSQATNRMVRGAVERLRAVVLEPLLANGGDGQTLADGVTWFHADHGNLAGTGAGINVTSLSLARTAMRRQRGLKGELLAVEPFAIVVPPELETEAQQAIADIQAAKFSDANPFSGALEVITEPGLTDSGAWYICGDPRSYDGLAVAYLDGQRAPRVESRPGWETLGVELRLVWALDAKAVEHASWYRNPGA